jgi:acetyl esterase/lipase
MHHATLLLGLHSPHFSLYREPDCRYTPEFSRVRYMLVALDAGVLSASRIRWPWLRNVVSIVMGVWYMIFARQGEDKVNAFRQVQTIDAIRRTWEKGQHPLLRTISALRMPKLEMKGIPVNIARPHGSGLVDSYLYFDGNATDLARQTRVVCHFHGGGFVAMKPKHHEDYLTVWAKKLKVPILSVNYQKAPEHPYPAGFNDCFDVYKALVESRGEIMGIALPDSAPALSIALVGDSAGGNFVAAVTLRAIHEGMRLPNGIHMIYPCLDMAGEMWRKPLVDTLTPDGIMHSIELPESKANETDAVTSLPHHDDDGNVQHSSEIMHFHNDHDTRSGDESEIGGGSSLFASGKHIARDVDPMTGNSGGAPVQSNVLVPAQLTTRGKYAFDGVLPLQYMLRLGEAYLASGGDPLRDPYISPLRASLEDLRCFPPTYIHCGSADPLMDDSKMFAAKLHDANPEIKVQLHFLPGVSHAYMHAISFLPSAKIASKLSIEWIAEILDIDRDTVPQVQQDVRSKL